MLYVFPLLSILFWGFIAMKMMQLKHLRSIQKMGGMPQQAAQVAAPAPAPTKRVVGPALLKGIKKAVTWTAPRLWAGSKVVGMTTARLTAKAVKKGHSATVHSMAEYRKRREAAAPKAAVSANVETDWSQYDTPPYMRQEQPVDRPTIH